MILVSLTEILYYIIASLTQGYKWVPVRIEVDIVFEKTFRVPRQPGLYTPQGAEKDYRNVIGPMNRALM